MHKWGNFQIFNFYRVSLVLIIVDDESEDA